jgi:hypothetical protein
LEVIEGGIDFEPLNKEEANEFLKELYRQQFISAQREARSAKRGIWALPDYEKPKDFRKRLKIR